MASQKANSCRQLDPNASPYLRLPPTRFYLYVTSHPHHSTCILPPVVHSPHFWTYNIRLQPSSPKPFPICGAPSKKINLSGPRIPKPPLKLQVRVTNQMQWRPKFSDNKTSSVNGVEKQRFHGTRWKNIRKGYHEVLPLETNTTSLMIKNIPNKYTRKLLITTLDDHCEAVNKNKKDGDKGSLSAYDFVYLPIDFNRRLNAGFAFVNFTTPEAALRFREAFHGKRWNLFGCSKVAEISRARIQGKNAMINNCKGMNFSCGSEEDMPVCFEPARNGSGQIASKMFTVGKCFY
ncbi:hypothetical protein R6Q57_029764 [Mikania cordata]